MVLIVGEELLAAGQTGRPLTEKDIGDYENAHISLSTVDKTFCCEEPICINIQGDESGAPREDTPKSS